MKDLTPKKLCDGETVLSEGDSVPATMPENATVVRKIVWKGGVPMPYTGVVVPSESVAELAMAALSLPFEDTTEEHPDLKGMSNLEAALVLQARVAANGGIQALETLLDRAIGKPKQNIETKKLTMSYMDYLDSIKSADVPDDYTPPAPGEGDPDFDPLEMDVQPDG